MRYLAVVLALVLVYLAVLRIPAPPIKVTVALSDPVSVEKPLVSEGWRDDWCTRFINRIGQGSPTQGIVDFCWEWTMAEDSSDGAYLRNNPLNTTQESATTTMVINSDGVKGYATLEDGLDMSVVTINYGYYVAVVDAVLRNDPDGARSALWESPWASSHYGYGASWPRRAR